MFINKQIQKRTPEEKEKLLKDIQQIGVTVGLRQFNVGKIRRQASPTTPTSETGLLKTEIC